ncbi:UNVERIFIED_CONTAM: hypothetical protein NCL1_41330 [Trichonephila clavipes]
MCIECGSTKTFSSSSDSEDEGNVIQKQKPPKSSELQSNSAEINDQSAPDFEDSSKATNKEETANISQ